MFSQLKKTGKISPGGSYFLVRIGKWPPNRGMFFTHKVSPKISRERDFYSAALNRKVKFKAMPQL